jgi:hypothetical protein
MMDMLRKDWYIREYICHRDKCVSNEGEIKDQQHTI